MLVIAQVQNAVAITGTVTVSASSGAPIATTGTVHVDNPFLGQVHETGTALVTSSVSAPVYVSFTGSVPTGSFPTVTVLTGAFPSITVSQSNTPAGNQAVTQGGAWSSLVSGTVGCTQNGAFAVLISGTVTASLTGGFASSSGSASFTGAMVAVGGLYAWSADSLSLRPLASEPTDSDAEPVIVSSSNSPGVLSTEAYGKVFNGTTWDRMRGSVISGVFVTVTGTAAVSQSNTPAGNQAVVQGGALAAQVSGTVVASGTKAPADQLTNPTDAQDTMAFLMGWNTGSTWDRVVSEGNSNDAKAVLASGVLMVKSNNMVFNGTTWDRMRGSVASGAFVTVTGTAAVTASQASPVWVTQSQPVGVSSSQFIARGVVANEPALPARVIFPIEHLSAFGELLTTTKVELLPLNFNYNWPGTGINTAFMTSTFVSGGGLTVSSSMLQVSSSTNSSGSSKVESLSAIRYLAGTGLYSSFTAIFTSGVANSQQEIGLGDTQDGMFWAYSGTQFGAIVRKGSVDTFIPTGSFSIDHLDGTGASGFSLSPTDLELLKIEVGWHGSGPIKFYVFDVTTGRWVLGHIVSGNVTSPRLLNPTLPVHVRTFNFGNTSNIILKTASIGVYRESSNLRDSPIDGLNVATGSSLAVAATELPVISIQVTSSINGLTNRARVLVASISITDAGAAGTVLFVRARLNPTLTGPAFAPYNSGTSVLNFDTAASAVSSGSVVFQTVSNGQSSTYQDITALSITLNPGDVLAVTAQHVAGGSSTSVIGCSFKELQTG